MDRLREFLERVRKHQADQGRFRGLLHLLIGGKIARTDGSLISAGMTWREAAALLKKLRWDREAVRELGIDPAELPPRDREKFWYLAISRADLASPSAAAEAASLLQAVEPLGYSAPPPSS